MSVSAEIARLANVALAEVAPKDYVQTDRDGTIFTSGANAYQAALLASSRVEPERACVCPAHRHGGYEGCAKVRPVEALIGITCWRAS